jgi:hypothetical protein
LETTYSNRIRVNTEISVKGVETWSCTVEMVDKSIDEVLKELDELVTKLRKRHSLEGTNG